MSLTVSTSTISTASAALQILKRPSPLDAINSDPSMSPMDRLTAIVNAVSSEDSPAKTDAASKITSSLLDQQESADSLVARAVKLLDSDKVRCSDPKIKGLLKDIVEGGRSEFTLFYRKELADKPGISDDNALANALYAMITKHRDRLGDDEFVLGIAFAQGGGIMWNVEDKNGNSTDKTLLKRQKDLQNEISLLFRSSSTSSPELSRLLKDIADVAVARSNYFEDWKRSLGLK